MLTCILLRFLAWWCRVQVAQVTATISLITLTRKILDKRFIADQLVPKEAVWIIPCDGKTLESYWIGKASSPDLWICEARSRGMGYLCFTTDVRWKPSQIWMSERRRAFSLRPKTQGRSACRECWTCRTRLSSDQRHSAWPNQMSIELRGNQQPNKKNENRSHIHWKKAVW